MADPAQTPNQYSPLAATSSFSVGPHNVLIRNGIVFNQRSSLECYWIDEFTGFDSADIIASSQQNVQEDGENPDPTFYGGRTMTLTGTIIAGNYPTLLNMTAALRDSLVSLVEKPMMISTPFGSMLTQEPMFINCKKADFQVSKKLEATDISGVIKRNFTVALRASDPTFKAGVEKHATIVPAVVSQLGRIYKRTYPLVYATSIDSDGTPIAPGTTNSKTLLNAGNYKSFPTIGFTGPMTGIVVKNNTTGQSMRVSVVNAGEYIEIDTHPLSGGIRDQDGVLRASLLDSTSDWMWLTGKVDGADGNNDLQVVVSTFGSGGQVDLWWFDTSI